MSTKHPDDDKTSSDEQTSIATETTTPRGAIIDKRAERAVRCGRCGATVSQQFRRVFGDNDDRVHACIKCASKSDLMRGIASGRVRSRGETL